MEYNEKACIKALIYSSIFQYPLTKQEIWQYAISEKSLDKKKLFRELDKSKYIDKKGQFYVLSKNTELITIRKNRSAIASSKLKIAKKVSSILSHIPTIQFIGLSGSLAMNNTKEVDDIDFFIITTYQTLWLTRIIILLILAVLGKRRTRYVTHAENKVCINFLLETSHMSLPDTMKNLYTAHEVAQVKPLFNRNHTYERFIDANRWVQDYLPNALDFNVDPRSDSIRNYVHIFIIWLNFVAKKAQLWYMKKQRTSEIITDSVLAFYTDTMPRKVLRIYSDTVKNYEI